MATEMLLVNKKWLRDKFRKNWA